MYFNPDYHDVKLIKGPKYGGLLMRPWWKLLWIKFRGSRHVEYLEDFNIAVFYHYNGITYLTFYGKFWKE